MSQYQVPNRYLDANADVFVIGYRKKLRDFGWILADTESRYWGDDGAGGSSK